MPIFKGVFHIDPFLGEGKGKVLCPPHPTRYCLQMLMWIILRPFENRIRLKLTKRLGWLEAGVVLAVLSIILPMNSSMNGIKQSLGFKTIMHIPVMHMYKLY